MLYQPCLHAVKPGSFERLKEFYASECCTEYEVNKSEAIEFVEKSQLNRIYDFLSVKFEIRKINNDSYSWVVYDNDSFEMDCSAIFFEDTKKAKGNMVLYFDLR
jgi:hypothetical protein